MNTTCSHEGCVLQASKAGYCNAHYIRKRRGTDMDVPVRRAASDPERFWEKVRKSDGCWEWTAFRDRRGYGRFMIERIPRLAHRVSFERANGPIPEGLEVDHMCHNRACVRPDHLRLATGWMNRQNLSGARADSTSGVRGVRQRPSGRWSAQAQMNGQRTYLGLFDSMEEANAAVTQWRRLNMPDSLMDQEAS